MPAHLDKQEELRDRDEDEQEGQLEHVNTILQRR
jgi:hypothetical protein